MLFPAKNVFRLFGILCALAYHDLADGGTVEQSRKNISAHAHYRRDTRRFSGGANRMLYTQAALRKKFRAETAPRDKEVIDPFHDKRTVGNLVPVFAVLVRGDLYLAEVERFTVDIHRVIGLTEHIRKFGAAEQIGGCKYIFRRDIAAFAHADLRCDLADIGIFEPAEIFFIKLHLADYALFAIYLNKGKVCRVGTVGMLEKFRCVECKAARSAGNGEDLPVCAILRQKIARSDSLIEHGAQCPLFAVAAGGIKMILPVFRRKIFAGFGDLFTQELPECIVIDITGDIAKRNRLVFYRFRGCPLYIPPLHGHKHRHPPWNR